MEYIILIIFLILMLILLKIICNISIKQIKAVGENKELDEKVKKYPSIVLFILQ